MGGAGGVAILLRNNLVWEDIKDFGKNVERMECVRVRIKERNKGILIIVGIYRRPEINTKKGMWKKLMNFDKKGTETLIMGDFNCHNTLYRIVK